MLYNDQEVAEIVKICGGLTYDATVLENSNDLEGERVCVKEFLDLYQEYHKKVPFQVRQILGFEYPFLENKCKQILDKQKE